MTPLLEIRDLSHVYSAGTPFESTAIEHIHIVLHAGEFVGVIGHTGSGKSTLLQHCNALLKPTSGQVLFEGRDVWESAAFTRQLRFQVGLVFQYPEHQLFEETVFQDIAFGPKNMGLSEAEVRERVIEAAGFVGVSEDLLDSSPFELSGGQKRRVAIAGVIAMRPKILILDEPTAGLDPAGRESILQNIRDYRERTGAAVVMVSHSMEEIAASVDRIIVMNKGSVYMDAPPSEVFSHAEELTEIGLDVPQVTQVFARLRELGLPVRPDVYTVGFGSRVLLALKGGSHA
ncbi:MAG: energy-coupling factor transporter ATPase [Oscillospiraceae bacterium]|nr:energy-coupling factor transporter ATPase [Oscillospiraceae bacterium]